MKKDQQPFVHLSLRHLDLQKIKSRFSNICQKLKEFGYDMTTDLLPIAPAAHYMVGGIKTGLYGETNIPGLFACGEVASTGVMGANRLASNSLLECLVFGKRASEKAAACKTRHSQPVTPEIIVNRKENELFFLNIKNEIADLMSSHVGIVRNEEDLKHALARLEEIRTKIPGTLYDYNFLKSYQTTIICEMIIQSALLRKESRGGHIREEYKLEDPDFRVHIVQQKGQSPIFVPVNSRKMTEKL